MAAVDAAITVDMSWLVWAKVGFKMCSLSAAIRLTAELSMRN